MRAVTLPMYMDFMTKQPKNMEITMSGITLMTPLITSHSPLSQKDKYFAYTADFLPKELQLTLLELLKEMFKFPHLGLYVI